ncbi:hypothetical protein B9Q04_17990 [Candidatus Marsarchaeota G2 archaeon BE_D]|uniref:Uncharacterized protein n=1 Tax=Candidatus Marsarchaeota G2 archaeon BE_D TaxID=1978158 RepID=A0A2R6C583_9ARCH|nr:MAG: hypothetical protein B9Q04_17990 [Candidatus Marsarchaeota G2 archaeon BE_D]
MDVFTFFRDLNVFVRNKKRFSRAQGDGCSPKRLWVKPQRGKTSSFFGLLSEPVSKSSVEEWMRKVLGGEAELQPKATRISSHRSG